MYEKKTYHPNGALHIHACYTSEDSLVLQGEYKECFDNCQLKIHCFYKDGKIDGVYKEWTKNTNFDILIPKSQQVETSYISNKNLYKEIQYKDGKIHGVYKEYFIHTGKLFKEVEYRDGKINGSYKEWYKNYDFVRISCTYENDALEGQHSYYWCEDEFNESDVITTITTYSKGRKINQRTININPSCVIQ